MADPHPAIGTAKCDYSARFDQFIESFSLDQPVTDIEINNLNFQNVISCIGGLSFAEKFRGTSPSALPQINYADLG